MTRGVPLTNTEKQYILTNTEEKFPSQIADELGRHVHTIKNFLRENQDD
jgi:IS30 family transposase